MSASDPKRSGIRTWRRMCPADGRSPKIKCARNGNPGCQMDWHRRGEKSYNNGATEVGGCAVLAVTAELFCRPREKSPVVVSQDGLRKKA